LCRIAIITCSAPGFYLGFNDETNATGELHKGPVENINDTYMERSSTNSAEDQPSSC
jgi:hypothetical protein